VWLLGTQSEVGITNLAVMNSIVHVGASPPLVGMVFRPLTVPRHSYENIKHSTFYTLSSIQSEYLDPSHQASAKYAADESEFDKAGLTEDYTLSSEVPAVRESAIQMVLKWHEEHTLENGCIFMVGAIKKFKIDSQYILADGQIDHEAIGTLGALGLNTYYRMPKGIFKEYARP